MNTPKPAGRTKAARALKQLTTDELFFYNNAGYSYRPEHETPEQGRIRCARSLAQAERYANNLGWECEWQDDWSVGDHTKEFDCYDENPKTCETCVMRDADGNVLASLGCIDDATAYYRRVIEAELADEALVEYDRQTEIIDAH